VSPLLARVSLLMSAGRADELRKSLLLAESCAAHHTLWMSASRIAFVAQATPSTVEAITKHVWFLALQQQQRDRWDATGRWQRQSVYGRQRCRWVRHAPCDVTVEREASTTYFRQLPGGNSPADRATEQKLPRRLTTRKRSRLFNEALFFRQGGRGPPDSLTSAIAIRAMAHRAALES